MKDSLRVIVGVTVNHLQRLMVKSRT